jgi:hypothetical protein
LVGWRRTETWLIPTLRCEDRNEPERRVAELSQTAPFAGASRSFRFRRGAECVSPIFLRGFACYDIKTFFEMIVYRENNKNKKYDTKNTQNSQKAQGPTGARARNIMHPPSTLGLPGCAAFGFCRLRTPLARVVQRRASVSSCESIFTMSVILRKRDFTCCCLHCIPPRVLHQIVSINLLKHLFITTVKMICEYILYIRRSIAQYSNCNLR